MYDFISGELDSLNPTEAVIEAGGVGYLLNISLNTYTSIGSAKRVKLYVHYALRLELPILYGFYDRVEREVFRNLTSVSGVGGSTARMILSTFTSQEVCGAIATGQADVLKTVKGLGIKTAQKIIVELRDKIGGISGGDINAISGGDFGDFGGGSSFGEALSALTMLGFAKAASEKVLRAVAKEFPSAGVEELIRQSLKRM